MKHLRSAMSPIQRCKVNAEPVRDRTSPVAVDDFNAITCFLPDSVPDLVR
jgi:hypothetical protein